MIGKSLVRSLAGTAGEFSSPELIYSADLFFISVPPLGTTIARRWPRSVFPRPGDRKDRQRSMCSSAGDRKDRQRSMCPRPGDRKDRQRSMCPSAGDREHRQQSMCPSAGDREHRQQSMCPSVGSRKHACSHSFLTNKQKEWKKKVCISSFLSVLFFASFFSFFASFVSFFASFFSFFASFVSFFASFVSSLLPSSFVVWLSSYTRRRHYFSKALVYYNCFLVFRRIGETFSLDLFCSIL